MLLDEFTALYSFQFERDVEWGDMDAMQHVNNTFYFRYFERVRFEYFLEMGLIDSVKAENIGPILASTSCKFKVPLTYPDTVHLGTYITDLGDDRFLMKYGVFSKKLDRLAAEGEGLIVCYDYARGQKVNIPGAIKDKLAETAR